MPPQDQLDAIYADAGYYLGSSDSIGFSDYVALAPARRRMFERHLGRVAAYVEPGSIVDIGCATGDFLLVAQEHGWQPFGVDPSAARASVESKGIPLIGHTVSDLIPGSQQFSAITF